METLKTVIYAACIVGIISTMIDIASPEGSMKKQLDVIVGMILIMAVAAPFMGSNFTIRFSETSLSSDSKVVSELKDYEKKAILQDAENKVSEYFKSKMNNNGIGVDDIVIKTELNEYNQIEIKSVTVITSSDGKQIEDIIKSELPEARIIITAGDNN